MNKEIEEAVKGLQSENDRVREKHFGFIYPLCGSSPEKIYPWWDIFVEMLYKPEVSNKYYAIHILAELIAADSNNRFNDIYDYWFGDLLNHESPVVALHTVEKSGRIVLAKPALEKDITPLLINIDKTTKCRQKELQKAYVLSAIEYYYDIIADKGDVIDFIRDQCNSTSPKTRKKAQGLISKLNLP